MRGLLAALGALAALAGCSSQGPSPLGDGCTADVPTLERTLAAAPAPVVTADGTRLSECISGGQDDAESQELGIAFSRVAERLRVRAREGDEPAAVQLGYLVGATRRGASRTNGVMLELLRRVELVGGRLIEDVPAAGPAVERGRVAGLRTG